LLCSANAQPLELWQQNNPNEFAYIGCKVPEMREQSANVVECTTTSNVPTIGRERTGYASGREKRGIGGIS